MATGGRGGQQTAGVATIIVAATVLVMLLAGGAVLWSVQKQYRMQESHQANLAAGSVQSVAREIDALLGEMRRGVRMFADEQNDILSRLATNPADTAASARLEELLARHFPDRYAYTLTTMAGDLLIDDFGVGVGDQCRHDIHNFANTGDYRPIIHPGPGAFHFDLMVPWQRGREEGIFFLSFKPDRLARLLAAAKLPGHRLALVKQDAPDLIEVTEQGGRDVLGEHNRIDAGQAQRIQHLGAYTAVSGTGWLLLSIPDKSVQQSLLGERRLRAWTSLVLLLLAGGAIILATLWSERHRKRTSEQQRLAAAVFDSAQEGIAITDLKGNFVAVNRAFSLITEYAEDEVLGKSTRLLRSDRHGHDFYRDMWQQLLAAGSWQGEIWDRRKGGEVYLEWLTISAVRDETGAPVNYVAIYTDINRINHAPSHLERLAHYDMLTGLPNRLLMYSRLEHALEKANRTGGRVAVMFLDLDRFKQVNDQYGHAAGDELLQQVAAQLQGRLRDSDTLARLGGDEFVVLLEDVASGCRSAESVARDLIGLVSGPFILSGGRTADIGLSIGICLYPDGGKDANQLLGKADEAMYRAKEAGRNTFRCAS